MFVTVPWVQLLTFSASSLCKQLILELKGRLTLSDDSHGPKAVGLHYDSLYRYLLSKNVKELWYLDAVEANDTVKKVEGTRGRRRTEAKILPGDWWTHTFWKARHVY
jgi:histidinol-phosphatase (PHP family)